MTNIPLVQNELSYTLPDGFDIRKKKGDSGGTSKAEAISKRVSDIFAKNKVTIFILAFITSLAFPITWGIGYALIRRSAENDVINAIASKRIVLLKKSQDKSIVVTEFNKHFKLSYNQILLNSEILNNNETESILNGNKNDKEKWETFKALYFHEKISTTIKSIKLLTNGANNKNNTYLADHVNADKFNKIINNKELSNFNASNAKNLHKALLLLLGKLREEICNFTEKEYECIIKKIKTQPNPNELLKIKSTIKSINQIIDSIKKNKFFAVNTNIDQFFNVINRNPFSYSDLLNAENFQKKLGIILNQLKNEIYNELQNKISKEVKERLIFIYKNELKHKNECNKNSDQMSGEKTSSDILNSTKVEIKRDGLHSYDINGTIYKEIDKEAITYDEEANNYDTTIDVFNKESSTFDCSIEDVITNNFKPLKLLYNEIVSNNKINDYNKNYLSFILETSRTQTYLNCVFGPIKLSVSEKSELLITDEIFYTSYNYDNNEKTLIITTKLNSKLKNASYQSDDYTKETFHSKTETKIKLENFDIDCKILEIEKVLDDSSNSTENNKEKTIIAPATLNVAGESVPIAETVAPSTLSEAQRTECDQFVKNMIEKEENEKKGSIFLGYEIPCLYKDIKAFVSAIEKKLGERGFNILKYTNSGHDLRDFNKTKLYFTIIQKKVEKSAKLDLSSGL